MTPAAAVGCATGYTGFDCSINIDECDSFPCKHLGACIDVVGSYTCSCQVGWAGENCQSSMDASVPYVLLLSGLQVAAIAVGVLLLPAGMYALTKYAKFSVESDTFNYSTHVVASTLSVAAAVMATICFSALVRPAVASFIRQFQTMAPNGDASLAGTVVPCAQSCSATCICEPVSVPTQPALPPLALRRRAEPIHGGGWSVRGGPGSLTPPPPALLHRATRLPPTRAGSSA